MSVQREMPPHRPRSGIEVAVPLGDRGEHLGLLRELALDPLLMLELLLAEVLCVVLAPAGEVGLPFFDGFLFALGEVKFE